LLWAREGRQCCDVAVPVVAGLVAGIVGGAVAARFLRTMLYEVKPTDIASLAAPLVCIVLTCAMAAVPPALRAARTDPVKVLRHE
jgi:ABC-type lipoprotein release transport system permease subunit